MAIAIGGGGGRNCCHGNFAVESRRIRSRSSSSSIRCLRNVSTIPVFKKGVFKARPSVINRRCIFSMGEHEQSRSMIAESSRQKRVPVFVMMPLESLGIDTSGTPRIKKIKALSISLKALKLAGVHGIGVEVWWGIVERALPFVYDWSLYEQLFKLILESGLNLHVSLSFHSNTSLTPHGKEGVSLPLWIQQIGNNNKDIYYQDQNGVPNIHCLTLGVDELPLFCGRTALQCYEDFINNFLDKFDSIMGSVIEELSIGLGPAGELRYPSHPRGDGRWNFPGIGEFQCYDKYMMEDLRVAACEEGKPQWGDKGPQNAGYYNSYPSGIPFFEGGEESFLSDYGHFFLEWYSGKLIKHADAILSKAARLLKKYQESEENPVLLVAKVGVIYWWYETLSHAAELTAGYYNTAFRDGYDTLGVLLLRHRCALDISCLEMLNGETPPTYLCSPEGLVQQLRNVARRRTVNMTGRNYDERLDKVGLQQIQANCYHPQADLIRSFRFFRMSGDIFKAENWSNFVPFVRNMSPRD